MKKKALFIGGTGTISSAITRALAEDYAGEWELTLLNRGNRALPDGVKQIIGDINSAETQKLLENSSAEYDTVAQFIAFLPEHVERDYRLFNGKTKQYMFISSASAYQKPPSSHVISEATPLANPFWRYSRDKIACEDYLYARYRENGFPITVIRPSHTYCERSVPLGVHGNKGSFQVIKRMMEGKPVIVHGDGTSLWTMTHNRDFAAGFIGLMGNIRALGESVGITGDESLTWNQIYDAVANALGVRAKYVHIASETLDKASEKYDFVGGLVGDKANSVVFDNSKLKRLVPGFCAKIRFDQGIREVIEYVLSHPDCQAPDPEFDRFCDDIIARIEAIRGL